MEIGRLTGRLNYLAGKLHTTLAALGPHLGEREGRAQLTALLLGQSKLRLRVRGEAVYRHHDRKAELLYVLDVLLEVRYASSKSL